MWIKKWTHSKLRLFRSTAGDRFVLFIDLFLFGFWLCVSGSSSLFFQEETVRVAKICQVWSVKLLWEILLSESIFWMTVLVARDLCKVHKKVRASLVLVEWRWHGLERKSFTDAFFHAMVLVFNNRKGLRVRFWKKPQVVGPCSGENFEIVLPYFVGCVWKVRADGEKYFFNYLRW